MRIFTIISTCIILSAPCLSAQTVTRHDSLRIDVKSDRMPKVSKYNTWDIGLHAGITYPNTDISASDLNGSNVQHRLAYGLDFSKFFSHTFGLQARFMRGKISGIDTNKPAYRYNSDIDYDISLNAVIQIGNISFLKRTPNLAIYGTIGAGLIRYTPSVSIDGGAHYLKGIYSEYQEPYDTIDYTGTSDMVIPFGIGVKYRIGKSFSINGEYSLRTTNNDKMDGWFKLLSEDDDYSYFNLGLTYHIGKQEKVAEWVNPLQSLYADVYDMKDRIDLYGKDTDKDGVADLYDREPDTPEGTKVYGDGTSVDTDYDGVPDWKDAEPFSAKSAQVDAAGKEIDTDTDGIPDSRDLEPNTSKGTIVNNQGIALPAKSKGGGSSVLAANGYLPSIFFELNSDVILKKFDETLASMALILKKNPDVRFRISGNCDARASVEYNIKLGKRRAEAIKNHLVKKYNIDPDRLTTESLGKSDPITGDHPMNRRVDLTVEE
jgi:outer membrane protein OmpA-like peptidoglycan-associated protein